ncbi:MAG: hypothetical protein AAF699_07915 [Pseudomonadota bacterium]
MADKLRRSQIRFMDMNKLLTHAVYLDAMGIDTYVSRWQPSGALFTQRIALAKRANAATESSSLQEAVPAPVSSRRAAIEVPNAGAVQTGRDSAAHAVGAEHFSLLVVELGGWVWIEELVDSEALHEQQALLHAIGSALGLTKIGAEAQLSATLFDWPMHANRQLDQGEEAGRASATGYLRRRLDQAGCHGLVALGTAIEKRVTWQDLDGSPVLRTVGMADVLRDPMLKPIVWRDLKPYLFKA